MAMQLNAVMREKSGKEISKQIRRQGMVPAVIYGIGTDPIKITMDPLQIWKQLNSGKFYSAVYQMKIEGGSTEQIIVRDLQFHPVTDAILHADFYRIDDEQEIIVEIPINLLNQDKCPGIKRGGMLNVVRYKIPVKCKPKYIPETVDIDLLEYQLGQSIHISDIKLPDNISIPVERDFTIGSIAIPRGMTTSETEADAESDAEVEA